MVLVWLRTKFTYAQAKLSLMYVFKELGVGVWICRGSLCYYIASGQSASILNVSISRNVKLFHDVNSNCVTILHYLLTLFLFLFYMYEVFQFHSQFFLYLVFGTAFFSKHNRPFSFFFDNLRKIILYTALISVTELDFSKRLCYFLNGFVS